MFSAGIFRTRALIFWLTIGSLICFLKLRGQDAESRPYVFSTFAGVALSDSARFVDGAASEARFNRPNSVATDSSGNIYVIQPDTNAIRKIDGAGLVTIFAGSPDQTGSADGTGVAARFNLPSGIAIDAADNLYVADTANYTVRKISPAGVVTTFAGMAGISGSVDATGLAATFLHPTCVTVDNSGNVYVGDAYVVRKITPGGVVTTLAGSPGNFGFFDGVGSDAQFPEIAGLAVDQAHNLYVVAGLDYRVRRVTPDGVVSTFAGAVGGIGSADGPAEDARFYLPAGVAVDGQGNVYVGDTGNNTIRKITPAGIVTTLAGMPDARGSADGVGSSARFKAPRGLAVTLSNSVIVADSDNNTIRRVSPTGTVETIAGLAGGAGSEDGRGRSASFLIPYSVAVDSSDFAYVTDLGNSTIRKISPEGLVSTLAGTPGVAGYVDGTGAAASFFQPYEIAVDGIGNIYVTEFGSHAIRKITPGGVVTTLAGLPGVWGAVDGPGATARFLDPSGLAADAVGNVYVADSGNHTIRKITPAGVVTTVAGSAGEFGFVNATGIAARFWYPADVALDPAGNLYVADGNLAIRKITPEGVVTNFFEFSSRLSNAGTLAVDPQGNVFITTVYPANTIAKITPSGVLSVIGGRNSYEGSNDGVGSEARFAAPRGIAVSASGKIFLADSLNNTIRLGQLELPAPTFVLQPTNLVFAEGFPARFSASVDVQASFQWRKNSLNVPGATSSSLAFAALAYADAGVYQVIATNPKASTPSQTVTLTVVPRVAASGGAADFNGDGKADLLWSNALTGERAMWLMNGTGFLFSSTLGNFPLEWTIAATGDFNADGKTDVVWSNSITGERAIWLMNGTSLITSSTLGIFPLEWTVAATADFNADGKPDLIWSNSITGERAIWLMNGVRYQGSSTLGVFPLEWTVAATADFNADGKPDIIWSNRLTGERAIWLMNGTSFLAASTLGTFPLEWTVAGSADFNGDGKPDIIWSNAITGERALWLMNGTSFLGASSLGIFPLEWTVSN